MERKVNMKYWKKKKTILQYLKIHKKFKQHSIDFKNDMVHVPAKFWENTSMRFWVTVRKLNVTDGRTDGQTDRQRQTDRQIDRHGALQYLLSRAFGAAGGNKKYITNTIDMWLFNWIAWNKTSIFRVVLYLYLIICLFMFNNSTRIPFFLLFTTFGHKGIAYYIVTTNIWNRSFNKHY